MAFCMLLILLAFIFLHDRKVKKDRQHKFDEIAARGVFDETNYKLNKTFLYDFFHDWESNRTLVPKEYVRYFELNKKALFAYANAWVSEQEFKAGYRPFYSGYYTYDKHNFKPYERFNNQYLWRIQALNVHGKFIGE